MEAGAVDPRSADLRDMQGPTAISEGGWRRFGRILWRMAKTDFQLRFEQPILGYAWALLSPLLLAGVLYLAFTRFVRFGGDIENYPMLLIFNLYLFMLFRDGTSQGVKSFVAKQNLTRKMEFPLLAVPLSSVAAGVLNYLMAGIVSFGLLLAVGTEVRWTWLLFPPVVFGFIAVTAVGAVLLASLFVRIRDIGEIWTALNRAMFYASPVIIPIEFFPQQWHWILYINPLAPLLAQARVWVIDPDAPTYVESMGGTEYLLIPIGVFILSLVAAVIAFRKLAPRAAEI